MTVLFELGTALVVNLGMESGRDAWLSILLGCVAGLMVFTGYAYLYRKQPDLPFYSLFAEAARQIYRDPGSLGVHYSLH
ncbi:GerAB/ArcD/ProY family transporter [Paenibacillus rhizoplanae]